MTRANLRTLRQFALLLALMLIFAALVTIYGQTLGPFEGPDEEEHFAYVTHLMRQGRLPDWEADFEPSIHQEVGQAPLYYVAAALWGRLGRLESWTGGPVRNPWWPGVGVGAIPSTNHNHYLMKEGQHVLDGNLLAMAHAAEWLRLASLGFGVILLAGVYWAGMALWRDRRWALLAAALVAFTPGLLQVYSTISNDTAVIAFGTVIIAGSLHLYQQQAANNWLATAVGLAMGLAALSKVSGLALWPVPFIALGVSFWNTDRHTRRWQDLVNRAGLMLVTALLVSGWWYARGWLLYGDPLGSGPHQLMPWGRDDNPLTANELWAYTRRFWPDLWALFGWGFIRPPLWGFLLPLVAIVTSVIGWWRLITSHEPVDWKPIGQLLLVVLTGLAAVFYWLVGISIVPPRLFYPFYSAVVLLVVHGLTRFPSLRPWWAGAAAALAIIIVPTTLYPAYGTPSLFDTPPDDLQGQPVNFDGATLLGYSSEILDEARNIYGFRLCWMAPGEPHAMRHPFAVSILDANLQSVANLISYTGMGRYTYWQPDKGFCDRFSLELPPEPAHAYSIMVNLYDLQTRTMLFGSNPDGSPRQSGFIGMVAVPGVRGSARALADARYSFDDTLYLLDYSITPNNDSLDFTFVWATSRANQYPTVHQYIHIFDQNNQPVAQVDFGPSTSGYPISMWGANEQIEDHVSLPIDSLPPGDYRVMTGLYFLDDLQRLPVVDVHGDPVQDNNIQLGTFPVTAIDAAG